MNLFFSFFILSEIRNHFHTLGLKRTVLKTVLRERWKTKNIFQNMNDDNLSTMRWSSSFVSRPHRADSVGVVLYYCNSVTICDY